MELSITVPCSAPGPWGKCISQIGPVSSVTPDDSDWPRAWTCDSGRAKQSPSQRRRYEWPVFFSPGHGESLLVADENDIHNVKEAELSRTD